MRAPSADLAIRVPGTRAGLATALNATREWLSGQDVAPAAADRVALVVEEALMNVAMHGRTPEGAPVDLQAELALHLEPGTIAICLQDNGRAFNPHDAAPPPAPASAAEATPGGLGVHLLRHFARTMTYERRDGLNVLRLSLQR